MLRAALDSIRPDLPLEGKKKRLTWQTDST